MDYQWKEDDSRTLSDLEHAGVPLDQEVLKHIKAASRGLSIFQTGTFLESSVFDLDSGGSGYMLSVAICNDSTRPIRLQEFRLEVPWHDAQFRWLKDPCRASPRKSSYSLASPGLAEFDREVVLNHHVGSAGQLNPGESLEGLLLGRGEAPVPDEFRDRQLLTMKLLILDRRGCQYSSRLKLYVSRKSVSRTKKRAYRYTNS